MLVRPAGAEHACARRQRREHVDDGFADGLEPHHGEARSNARRSQARPTLRAGRRISSYPTGTSPTRDTNRLRHPPASTRRFGSPRPWDTSPARGSSCIGQPVSGDLQRGLPARTGRRSSTELERRGMLAYMQRTTVKLPDELDARLRHEAARRGRTVSELTREAIENLLGAQHGGRRLLAAGAGASGRDDISERIEEILANEVQPSH